MARCQDSKYWAVVPAAGIGRRVGGAIPKQYLEVAGAPIISHTLSVLCSHPSIEQVVVVLAPDDPWWPVMTSCSSPKPSFGIGARAPLTATGGKERCHSVLAGVQHLRALASGQDWVLVHDAARPCLAPADIDELISSVSADDAGGLLAAPVGDTLKQVGEDGYISSTVDRTGLWRALTPQMFRFDPLIAALERALASDSEPTDECQAMELFGAASERERIRVVSGDAANIKVTQSADLEIVARYLEAAGRVAHG